MSAIVPFSDIHVQAVLDDNGNCIGIMTPAGITYFNFPTSTWANLPLPGGVGISGRTYRVTDVGPAGAGSLWVSNGTLWRPVGGRVLLSTLGAQVSGIANTETIILQASLPAGMWQANDTIRLYAAVNKSGAVDTGNASLRLGTAGTVADTQLTGLSNAAILAAANLTNGIIFDTKLVSATSAQKIGPTSAVGSYTGTTNIAPVAATTITSVSANASFITFTFKSSSTTDTVGVSNAQFEFIAGS